MKKWIFAVCLLMQSVASLAVEPLTLLSHEFRPFTWTEGGKVQGFAYDMIQSVLQELDQGKDVEQTSFKRAWMRVQTEPHTAVFVASRSPEREHAVKWVGPLYSGGVYMYRLKGSDLKLESLDDLRKGLRIGVQNGLREDTVLTTAGVTKLFRSNSVELALRALLNKRVDAIPLGDGIASSLLRNEGLPPDAIEKTKLKLFDSSLYMAFSLDVSDETVRRWQQALDKVKQARYDALERQYIH